jgi:hypothetical protein
MPLTVDYIPYGLSASLMTQANYVTYAPVGAVTGIADLTLANKAWRQSSMISAAVANYIANNLQTNILDDGSITNLINNLTVALQVKAARIVTSSVNMVLNSTDYSVGFNRTSSPAATQVTLPNPAFNLPAVGQSYIVQDLANNAGTYNITVIPSAGTIAGAANYVINTNRGSAMFTYYGGNLWGLRT